MTTETKISDLTIVKDKFQQIKYIMKLIKKENSLKSI